MQQSICNSTCNSVVWVCQQMALETLLETCISTPWDLDVFSFPARNK